MPVVELGEGAFSGGGKTVTKRDAITSIVVPDSVVTIGENAFGFIDELTEVTLPDGLKVIPDFAFVVCKKLITVNLPASLEVIGSGAFSSCGELSNLVIPSTLTGVKFIRFGEENPNNGAFDGCGKLPIKTRQTIQGWGYTGSLGL
jgi:hypothetical protein